MVKSIRIHVNGVKKGQFGELNTKKTRRLPRGEVAVVGYLFSGQFFLFIQYEPSFQGDRNQRQLFVEGSLGYFQNDARVSCDSLDQDLSTLALHS